MTAKKTPRSNRRKPTGALAALAETKKGSHTLIGDIQQHAVKKAQQDDSRRQDIIHPSEMAKEDWCPRATAYRISGIQPSNPEKVHGYRLLTIFQEGHDIHSKWQTWLAEMGRLWGKWKCPVCEHTTWGLATPYCAECARVHPGLATRMQYAEVSLDAEDQYMICGHADGGVPDLKAFIEIKSIGVGTLRIEEPDLVKQHTVRDKETNKAVVDLDGLWKAIKRPLKSHRKQAGVYLAIAKYLGWDFDRMIFIYENKGNQDTKEFTIRYSDDLVADLLDTALDIKWAVENEKTLPRPNAFTRDTKPCKECPFLTWCWAGEEEDGESKSEPDAADGARVPRSKAETGSAEDLHAESTGERVPRSARRSNRTGRQRPDASNDSVHEVGRVPERTTGSGRGRRTVRRRVSG